MFIFIWMNHLLELHAWNALFKLHCCWNTQIVVFQIHYCKHKSKFIHSFSHTHINIYIYIYRYDPLKLQIIPERWCDHQHQFDTETRRMIELMGWDLRFLDGSHDSGIYPDVFDPDTVHPLDPPPPLDPPHFPDTGSHHTDTTLPPPVPWLLIVAVAEDSLAARAGLCAGDLIRTFGQLVPSTYPAQWWPIKNRWRDENHRYRYRDDI